MSLKNRMEYAHKIALHAGELTEASNRLEVAISSDLTFAAKKEIESLEDEIAVIEYALKSIKDDLFKQMS